MMQANQVVLALLPLSITPEDSTGTEKLCNLPARLFIEGAPAGSDPSAGVIAYNAPWSRLAIYPQEFGYSNGLVIPGKINCGMKAVNVSGSVIVTIERWS